MNVNTKLHNKAVSKDIKCLYMEVSIIMFEVPGYVNMKKQHNNTSDFYFDTNF